MDCTVCLNGDHSFHPTLVTIIVYHTTQQLSSLTNYELKLNPVSFTVKNRLPKLCEQLTFFFFFVRLAAGVAEATVEVGLYFLINCLLLPSPAASLQQLPSSAVT